jgi:hypothetical protein
MPPKLNYEEVKKFIDKEDELISKEYINSKTLLDIKCRKCGEIFQQIYTSYRIGHRHQYCIKPRIPPPPRKGTRTVVSKECIFCKNIFKPKRNSIKLCSTQCTIDYQKTPEYRNNGKINGSIGGRKSAESQQRRSKNEAYFSDLCIEKFGKDDVITNEPVFKDDKGNGWDADIIIISKKIAILWNGIFHYKQIFKKQSLEQVQNRDRIKMKVIENNGYTNYIIKDLGKFSKNFVDEQFELFLKSL